jgi:hypothetical protein
MFDLRPLFHAFYIICALLLAAVGWIIYREATRPDPKPPAAHSYVGCYFHGDWFPASECRRFGVAVKP